MPAIFVQCTQTGLMLVVFPETIERARFSLGKHFPVLVNGVEIPRGRHCTPRW